MISVEPLMPRYFDLAAEWLSDGELNRWLTSEWRGQTVIARMVAVVLRNRHNRLLVVFEDGEACGLVGFSELDETDGVAMIWYLLGRQPRGGKGIMTEAVAAALRIAFTDYSLRCVYAWIIDGNQSSRRVLEKNGFSAFGRMRLATKRNGEQVDRVYFDITKEDYDAMFYSQLGGNPRL
jgi:RimJ/RimL family protein N-acetyltransferase